jgi:hypothetical protein
MAFDPSALPADVRLDYLRIGSQFGSQDVLDQRRLMTQALAVHAEALAATGFGPDDKLEYEELEVLHDSALGGRGSVAVTKRTGTKEVKAAFTNGKTVRKAAHAVLETIEGRLRRSTDQGVMKARETLTTVLDSQTRTAGNPKRLLAQLVALKDAFSDQHVAAEGQSRGGVAILVDLTEAIAALDAATGAHDPSPGTPLQTEVVDVIEGALVEKFRLGLKAATAASARLGSPAIAHAFRLDELYPPSPATPQQPPTPPQ